MSRSLLRLFSGESPSDTQAKPYEVKHRHEHVEEQFTVAVSDKLWAHVKVTDRKIVALHLIGESAYGNRTMTLDLQLIGIDKLEALCAALRTELADYFVEQP